MKLFFHCSIPNFCNCYVLGSGEKSGDAIVVDPCKMDRGVLECIEGNDFNLRAVFITHDHRSHVNGLRALLRIYQVEVFSLNRVVRDMKASRVSDGDKIFIGPFEIEVISVPGHSADSVVYRIGTLLFTGDALTAGMIGPTASAYGEATQIGKLRSRIFSLPGDYIVLPGHGPPSTLEAERRFNPDITRHEAVMPRRPAFRLNL